MEALRKFCVYTYFFGTVEVFSESPLDAFVSGSVCEHIILNVLLGTVCFCKVSASFFCGEDVAVVDLLGLVVTYVFDDHRGFLLTDELDGLIDEFLRVVLEHGKHVGLEAGQDRRDGSAGEVRALCYFTDEVIFDLAALRQHQGLRACLRLVEAVPALDSMLIHIPCLHTGGYGIL